MPHAGDLLPLPWLPSTLSFSPFSPFGLRVSNLLLYFLVSILYGWCPLSQISVLNPKFKCSVSTPLPISYLLYNANLACPTNDFIYPHFQLCSCMLRISRSHLSPRCPTHASPSPACSSPDSTVPSISQSFCMAGQLCTTLLTSVLPPWSPQEREANLSTNAKRAPSCFKSASNLASLCQITLSVALTYGFCALVLLSFIYLSNHGSSFIYSVFLLIISHGRHQVLGTYFKELRVLDKERRWQTWKWAWLEGGTDLWGNLGAALCIWG